VIDDPRIENLTITIDDVRVAGHCARGAKTWFDDYGLDFRDFLINGIAATKFLATGDGLAERIVRLKLDRDNV
jgi:hypothetical protein